MSIDRSVYPFDALLDLKGHPALQTENGRETLAKEVYAVASLVLGEPPAFAVSTYLDAILVHCRSRDEVSMVSGALRLHSAMRYRVMPRNTTADESDNAPEA